ncbi:Adenylate and Guanylate cyclase catalytic domain containing protein [Tritrichomonas foetus]|uniref:Adenylate and Guanylate cyclase catalytic domain containing protein n=1 Tax=Tritrichomonas foetus TaxID=1144522 RepID=A0A1J4J572_9EUKA|nr:Adenylate and Guanylate cyclase catalytic domain containing protein [Tritrichomonas foetus]|eukprot:OHS93295.1 Adenylate and Guanylate cyclase catalytic domain containing protein [Tritrichomonas foetus]
MSGTVSTSHNASHLGSTNTSQFSNKYHGLIKMSNYKKIRNIMIDFFSYVYSVSPNFYPMHSFMSFYRIFQMMGPILGAPFIFLWENSKSKIAWKVSSFISVFIHLVPVESRDQAYIPMLFTIIGILSIYIICIFICAFYYKEKSQLPLAVPAIIAAFTGSVGYILPIIWAEFIGEIIGHMIAGTHNFEIVTAIVGIFVSIFLFSIYLWFFVKFVAVSATFRPNSLLSVSKAPQTMVLCCSVLITFFSAVASKSSKIICIVLLVITAIIYFVTFGAMFIDGGFVKIAHSVMVVSAAISGGLTMIIFIILVVIGQSLSELILIAAISLFVLIIIIASFIHHRIIYKIIHILDEIHSNSENFEMIRSPSMFMIIFNIGMGLVHPVCTSWSLGNMAVQKWPTNIKVWYIFSKFVAIYPEENQQLSIIYQNIIQNKIKGSYAKQTLAQIHTVSKLREANLSLSLKNSLNNINKLAMKAKHKMRYVWDNIIQANIGELENAVNSVYDAINECKSEYQHVLCQYPNNRFVSRSYSRFMLDVLADVKEFEKYDNITKLLQRGLLANEDQAHQHGVHAYPLLPSVIALKDNNQAYNTTENDLSTIDMLVDTDGATVEKTQTIMKQVEEVQIPAFVLLTKVRPILNIFICVFPLIVTLIYVLYIIEQELIPLDYIRTLSFLRCGVYMLPALSEAYVFEELQCITKRIPSESLPQYLGSSLQLNEQLEYFNKEASFTVSELKDLRDYKIGNNIIDQVRAIVFSNKIDYITYPDDTNSSYTITKPTTLHGAFIDYILMVTGILEVKEFTYDFLGRQNIQNQIKNTKLLSEKFTEATYLLMNYMSYLQKLTADILDTLIFIMSFTIFIVLIVSLIIYLIKSKKNKLEVYTCFTTVPKNVVSNIADRLKILKKNQMNDSSHDSSTMHTEFDMNKQEENMMKIFATAGSSSQSSQNGRLINIISILIIYILTIVGIATIGVVGKNTSKNIDHSAPHVNYLLGSFSYAAGVIDIILRLGSIKSKCELPNLKIFEILENGVHLIENSVDYFNLVRYGNNVIEPFDQYKTLIDQYTIEGNCSHDTLPYLFECINVDFRFHFFENIMYKIIIPTYYYQDSFSLDSKDVQNLWFLMSYNMYNDFFAPVFENVVDDVKISANKQIQTIIFIAVVFIFLIVLIEIFVLLVNLETERKLKFTMSLLQQCPPTSILHNPRINAILSGNFTLGSQEKTVRNSEFFLEIIKNLPDAVIIMKENQTITEINKKGKSLFNIEFRENMHVNELFNFTEYPQLAMYFSPTASQMVVKQSKEMNYISFKNSDNQYFLQVTVSKIKAEIVITIRDVTTNVRYNNLIAEERAKSDVLLSSILPPKLVQRVRSGEKDISFAVQSATITFIDIVEFTPWCASLQAHEVMLTLNKLFTLFDAIVQKLPTMTRIKCIGDCYMAAGGIFAEVNQPEVHAKEVCEFGIDALDAVEKLNKELTQNIRIRVGVNTGGPIVAGVIGVGKPTFEILGPAINMAQQMEHHGVPMAVHVSRRVYELIYGGSFTIKERGEIEVKNGKVLTYLVYRKA